MRIFITSGPVKKKPKTGDTRNTKKYGLQVRIPQTVRGMRVVSNGRQLYEWCDVDKLPPNFNYLKSNLKS